MFLFESPRNGSSPPPSGKRADDFGDTEETARPIVLHKSIRQATSVDVPSKVALPIECCSSDALGIWIGARRRVDTSSNRLANVEFVVRAVVDGGEAGTQAQYALTLKPGQDTSRWHELRVDLSELRDKQVELQLELRGPRTIEAFWGSPFLIDRTDTPSHPDVILISVDTLAAQHMELYGYDRETTPQLTRFARDAVTFEQAITQQSWTLTAHASLMTSQYPDTHRVSIGSAIPPTSPLLPALLRDAGFYAAGLVNNPYLDPRFGYRQAYDIYDFNHKRPDDEGRKKTKRSIERSNEILEAWLSPEPPRPFFLFYHVIDPHSDWRDLPYEAPEPYSSLFAPDRIPVLESPTDSYFLARVNQGNAELSPAQLSYVKSLYDGGLAYTDQHLGKFLDLLRARGLYEDAMIIVTSDHGEEFLQHGRMMHSQGYDECLRVPLLIKFPGGRYGGTRVGHQVQLIDVLPTILDELGLAIPPQAEGRTLLGSLRGEAVEPRIAFSKGENYAMTSKDVYVVRSESWKLIWWLKSDRSELYNLAEDPGEQENLAERLPRRVGELRKALLDHRRSRNDGFRLRIPEYAAAGQLEIHLTGNGPIEYARPWKDGKSPSGFPLVSVEGNELSILVRDGREAKAVVGVDFDLASGTDGLTLAATLDGAPLPADRLRLGESGAVASELPIRLRRGDKRLALGTDTTADYERRTTDPVIYLWEVRADRGASVQLSGPELEALRALGYVQ